MVLKEIKEASRNSEDKKKDVDKKEDRKKMKILTKCLE